MSESESKISEPPPSTGHKSVLGSTILIADDERLPFEDAIRRSPLEQANESAPNFCSYHGQITSE